LFFNYSYSEVNDPKDSYDPDDPSVVFDSESENKENKTEKKFNYNIKYLNKAGILKKGYFDKLSGNYLKLRWEENESGTQEILVDFVVSIRIKGYKILKEKYNDLLSIVYYYPYVYDIKLKDGTLIKNAKGRISEIDNFIIYNNIGKERCYTYFVRYWLEDKQMFNDNKSKDFNENPHIPDSVIIYIEFFNDKEKKE
jgi:hypothetical protein